MITLTAPILDSNILSSGTKPQNVTPKRYGDHLRHLYNRSPLPPGFEFGMFSGLTIDQLRVKVDQIYLFWSG